MQPSATAVWAPTGIAIAANLIFGYRVWPAFLVGAFVTNVTTAGSIETSLAIAAGNALEGFTGAWLVNRFAKGRLAFQAPPDVLKFAIAAAGAAPIVSATAGVTSLTLGGYSSWGAYGPVWETWWLGDATGALIVAPLIVLWFQRPTLRWHRSRFLEAGVLFLSLILIAGFVFSDIRPAAAKHFPALFLVLPVLVWAALRLGPRATATAVFTFSVLAVWRTWRGLGLFTVLGPNATLLLLQSFTAVLSVTLLSLAAAVLQRNELLLAEQRARALAEAAVKARDGFLSIAAHELRTPIAALKGSAQLLQRRRQRGELDPARLDRMLDIITGTSDRLTDLVNELLDVSRIEMDRFELRSEQIDLGALLESSVERARDLMGEEHTFSLSVSGRSNIVLGDPKRLDQVWTNLLENAVKYSPAGGEVAVRLHADADDGLVISVRDHGIGLPPGAEHAIFEPFGRAPNAAAGQFTGMGLGLYICRKIVEQHGGRIWPESAGEGDGACVCVRLPRCPTDTGVPAGA